MSLRYPHFEDIQLKSGSKITLNALNAAFKKLVENDNSLIPENSILPKIWECKWFNDYNVQGYSKGEAVWVNTEPLDAFTASRYQTILNYLLESPAYRTKVEALMRANDTQQLYLLCRSMVQAGKIFYIGDLTKPVQIKISVADNNKDLPIDTSSKWKDFFVLADDQSIRKKFEQVLAQQTKELLDLHVSTYHLPETFPVEDYLLRDLSNLDQGKVQRCKSTKYRANYSGFDYVLLTATKQYAGKTQKWFRIWSSGYLEHGGTIDLEADSIPEGDIKTECTYTVNLGWKYGAELSNIAPTYEYQPIDFMEMYCTALSSDFDVGAGAQEQIEYDLSDMISVKTRYVVSLTPGIAEHKQPYSDLSFHETLDLYETNAVNSIDNGSFMFYFQPKEDRTLPASTYSYYCSGFSTTMFDRVRKQLGEEETKSLACECR